MPARGAVISRWWAAVLVAALVVHAAVAKAPDRLWEMAWTCHVATLVMAAGIALGRRAWIATGLLFHLPVGVGTYLIDVVAQGRTAPTSIVVHLLPSVIGLVAVHREDLSWRAALAAWGLLLAMLPITYALAPPALNVNLAHRAWPPFASWLTTTPANWAFNLAVSGILVAIATLVLGRLVPSRADGRARDAAP